MCDCIFCTRDLSAIKRSKNRDIKELIKLKNKGVDGGRLSAPEGWTDEDWGKTDECLYACLTYNIMTYNTYIKGIEDGSIT